MGVGWGGVGLGWGKECLHPPGTVQGVAPLGMVSPQKPLSPGGLWSALQLGGIRNVRNWEWRNSVRENLAPKFPDCGTISIDCK